MSRSRKISTPRAHRAIERDSTSQSFDAQTEPRPAELVARSIQLATIRFLRLNARTSDTAFSELPTEVDFEAGFTRPSVSQKDRWVAITCEFRFEIAPKDKTLEPVFQLNATTELVYNLTEGAEFDVDALNDFAAVNAPFNAWPYWREVLHTASARLGVPLMRLPVVVPSQIEQYMIEATDR